MELQNHPEILVGYFSVFFFGLFVYIHVLKTDGTVGCRLARLETKYVN